jgi:hypothetical protein
MKYIPTKEVLESKLNFSMKILRDIEFICQPNLTDEQKCCIVIEDAIDAYDVVGTCELNLDECHDLLSKIFEYVHGINKNNLCYNSHTDSRDKVYKQFDAIVKEENKRAKVLKRGIAKIKKQLINLILEKNK